MTFQTFITDTSSFKLVIMTFVVLLVFKLVIITLVAILFDKVVIMTFVAILEFVVSFNNMLCHYIVFFPHVVTITLLTDPVA